MKPTCTGPSVDILAHHQMSKNPTSVCSRSSLKATLWYSLWSCMMVLNCSAWRIPIKIYFRSDKNLPVRNIYPVVLNNNYPLGHVWTNTRKHHASHRKAWGVVYKEKVWIMYNHCKVIWFIEPNPNGVLQKGGSKWKGRLYGWANSLKSVR